MNEESINKIVIVSLIEMELMDYAHGKRFGSQLNSHAIFGAFESQTSDKNGQAITNVPFMRLFFSNAPIQWMVLHVYYF